MSKNLFYIDTLLHDDALYSPLMMLCCNSAATCMSSPWTPFAVLSSC
jgi:hypothetical protein